MLTKRQLGLSCCSDEGEINDSHRQFDSPTDEGLALSPVSLLAHACEYVDQNRLRLPVEELRDAMNFRPRYGRNAKQASPLLGASDIIPANKRSLPINNSTFAY